MISPIYHGGGGKNPLINWLLTFTSSRQFRKVGEKNG